MTFGLMYAHAGAMILGVGTDLAEVPRIKRSIEVYGERFLNRIYTPGEQAYASRRGRAAESFAARFAAKEAAMKAIGTGMRGGVKWKDFEVANERSGRPTLWFQGVALERANAMGVKRVSISLTHTAELAFAVVIVEDGG
jgi:holo-[acyl-carrier protein] synthase